MKYSPADNRVRFCVSNNVLETDSTLKRWLICQTKKISLQKSAVLRNAAVLCKRNPWRSQFDYCL